MNDHYKHENKNHNLVFDASLLRNQPDIPQHFIWPYDERPCNDDPQELAVPLIDLNAFLSEDPHALSETPRIVHEACKKHGFFIVINHGIDLGLIQKAHEHMECFFGMTLSEKQKAQRKVGEHCGYASSFTGRFSSKLPWKETLSFRYLASDGDKGSLNCVEEYFLNVLGNEFGDSGKVYQEYCEAMCKLSLGIMELLGMSLGVGRQHFKEFFRGNDSIMRLNYYPPCQRPDLTLGTGPHCDPTSLTILHQDQVGGLQVFVDGKWHSLCPNHGALVVNIGDTFMALSNGIYKSCLHRAVVNSTAVRKSLAFFLCPNKDKLVAPPSKLLNAKTASRRTYPDFTWPTLLEFTQRHYRADMKTLDAFTKWLQEQHRKKQDDA
ncbi:gibberellin 20 oxidase 1-D-like [Punica granatum]|uniref:Fe2OG dioxygenase domain-containing protein n=2 Tax=Punica granatum TaxID=22663 RepID=A0A218Y2T7_PUNGR|nr:gibberellin 20 oxidase 1-D-like [Punica granatum]OWM91593.1 hypothetical protein CDL15_Pgr022342 [Punica granatum]PKI54052.1 hypothetical protein CRG98_025546 [Punica granatum]